MGPPPLPPPAPLLSPEIPSVYNTDPESSHIISTAPPSCSLLRSQPPNLLLCYLLVPLRTIPKTGKQNFLKMPVDSVPRYLKLFTAFPFMKDQMLSMACKTLSQLASAFCSRLFLHLSSPYPPNFYGSDI